MLTGWCIQVYFVSQVVGHRQVFHLSDVQPLHSKIPEERMANQRTLKYFDSLAINFQLHLTLLGRRLYWSRSSSGLGTLLLSLGSQLLQLVLALESKYPDEETSQYQQ